MKKILISLLLLYLVGPLEIAAVDAVALNVKEEQPIAVAKGNNPERSGNIVKQKFSFIKKRLIQKVKKMFGKHRKRNRDRTHGERSLRWIGWGYLFGVWFIGIAFVIVSFVQALKGLKHDENPRKAIAGFVLSTTFLLGLLAVIMVAGLI